MIDTSNYIEKFLQRCRFRIAKDHLEGDVLDFGGNRGELGEYVKGNYLVVNYDHSPMKSKHFDSIVCLAVIEHISVDEVFNVFHKFNRILNKKGHVLITTPTVRAKPILEFLAFVGIIQKDNIDEHKHYWNKDDLQILAQKTGFKICKYQKFQLGLNQFAVLKHKNTN